MNYKIGCVVVTFNRKALLKRCLDAVAVQTFKPKTVYIIDNASTDDTLDSVKEWGYYNCVHEGVIFKYVLNSKNEGGAGGFYLGMKTAFEDGDYDALWVMDDDGEPEKNCLEYLVSYLSDYDYIAPIVLSDDDHITCSFSSDRETLSEFCKRMKAHDGIIENWASPFNGILYSSKYLSLVGYPLKDLFIWGDERNYHFRALKNNITPITIVDAVHYHPINRQECVQLFSHFSIIVPPADWKLYCYIRNLVYSNRQFRGNYISIRSIVAFIFLYGYFFIKESNYHRFKVVYQACIDGYKGNLKRLYKFLNK